MASPRMIYPQTHPYSRQTSVPTKQMLLPIALCIAVNALGVTALPPPANSFAARLSLGDPAPRAVVPQAADIVGDSSAFNLSQLSRRQRNEDENGALLCGIGDPCSDGSCCGTSGKCGYGPEFCGKGNCTSLCDAVAMCGQYGDPELNGGKCGMGLCCGFSGWCGTGAAHCNDFPGAPCQKGYGSCEIAVPKKCGSGSASSDGRTIGYYQGSNTWNRACNVIRPNDIDTSKYTHLYYSFASIDPATYQIVLGDSRDEAVVKEFTALKSKGVKTWIAVGGFDFSDPGPTHTTWSDLVSTAARRATFISSLKTFMVQYGFQGVDIDWEYPVDSTRGGAKKDTANLVLLVKEMRASFGTAYGISMALAPDIWYLRHFDAAAMEPYVDWFGFMSYDLHGFWDGLNANLGSVIRGQAGIDEITNNTAPLYFASLDFAKINFGLANYGRGYTVASKSCTDLGCPFSGPSKPFLCTNSRGVMSLTEIENLIKSRNLQPKLLGPQMMKSIQWDDQWMGYDDAETFALKKAWADDFCFGGTMAWSVDYHAGAGNGNDVPETNDGTCGYEAKMRCGTGENQCCSAGGWCGDSKDHCGAGCQGLFGSCTTGAESVDGTCGSGTSNNLVCGKILDGPCCSASGWCGWSKEHCSTGNEGGIFAPGATPYDGCQSGCDEWADQVRKGVLSPPNPNNPKPRWTMVSRPGRWHLQQLAAGETIAVDETEQPVESLRGAGAGVDIYIFDSGIRTSHVAFDDGEGGSRASNFKSGPDTPYMDRLLPWDDVQGHGTHVAGLAGGARHGVAQFANLINVKVQSCEIEYYTDDQGQRNSRYVCRADGIQGLLNAIKDVTAQHIAKQQNPPTGWKGSVINLSLGITTTSGLIKRAVEAAYNAGIPIAVAAGNREVGSKDKASGILCESQYTMCVGATTRRYRKLDIAKDGPNVDIWAPGDGLVSASIAGDQETTYKTGTSMATPLVAGIMATIVGLEGILMDGTGTQLVYDRIKANALKGVIQNMASDEFNAFAQTGINYPKERNQLATPYDGAPKDIAYDESVWGIQVWLKRGTNDIEVGYQTRDVKNTGSNDPKPVLFIQDPLNSENSPGPGDDSYMPELSDGGDGDTGLPACQGNQIYADCQGGKLPVIADNSGTQQPVCMKADNEPGSPARLNDQKLRNAVIGYCKQLVDQKWLFKEGGATPSAVVLEGEAQDGKSMAILAMYYKGSCPSDKSEMNMADVGLTQCVDNFAQNLPAFCSIGSDWPSDKYVKDFEVLGGIFATDCIMYAAYGGAL